MFIKYWSRLFPILALSGCIIFGSPDSIDITSNKDVTYNKKIERILVVNNLTSAPWFGREWEPVVQALSDSLNKHGLPVQTIVPFLEIQSEKGKDLKYAIATFKPTQEVDVNAIQYWSGHGNRKFTVQISIVDVAQQHIVWKSTVEITTKSDRAGFKGFDTPNIVKTVIQRLEVDGLLAPPK